MTKIKPRDMAILAHGSQLYGGRPYIYHIDMVVELVNTLYGESPKLESLQRVAYAHDILEDTVWTKQELHSFGYTKAEVDAVLAITKQEGESYTDYITKVMGSKLARKVKIADTMANLTQSTKEGQTKRILKYTKQLQLLHKIISG